jgi:excisionase family DNA binding protein
MEEKVLSELHEIKRLTLLGAKRALTMTDASLLTGLSKSHLYKLVCRKAIPYYKSDGGKLTYFEKSEVEAWQLQHRVKPAYEIEQEAANHLIADKEKRTKTDTKKKTMGSDLSLAGKAKKGGKK